MTCWIELGHERVSLCQTHGSVLLPKPRGAMLRSHKFGARLSHFFFFFDFGGADKFFCMLAWFSCQLDIQATCPTISPSSQAFLNASFYELGCSDCTRARCMGSPLNEAHPNEYAPKQDCCTKPTSRKMRDRKKGGQKHRKTHHTFGTYPAHVCCSFICRLLHEMRKVDLIVDNFNQDP